MKNYFEGVNNLQELKKMYYKLAMEHHPDRGGNTATMQEINNQYEKLSASLINGNTEFSAERKQYETEASEELKNKINEIINFKNIIIEICGTWLWITGNTYPIKDELKKAAFKFSHNKTAWYFHAEGYRKRSKKTFGLDDIRRFWGSDQVKQDQKENYSIA